MIPKTRQLLIKGIMRGNEVYQTCDCLEWRKGVLLTDHSPLTLGSSLGGRIELLDPGADPWGFGVLHPSPSCLNGPITLVGI